jgi:hypothetical protein
MHAKRSLRLICDEMIMRLRIVELYACQVQVGNRGSDGVIEALPR